MEAVHTSLGQVVEGQHEAEQRDVVPGGGQVRANERGPHLATCDTLFARHKRSADAAGGLSTCTTHVCLQQLVDALQRRDWLGGHRLHEGTRGTTSDAGSKHAFTHQRNASGNGQRVQLWSLQLLRRLPRVTGRHCPVPPAMDPPAARCRRRATLASLLVVLTARSTGATSCLQLALQLEATVMPCLAGLQTVLDGTATAASAVSSVSGATLLSCCAGLATFNAASCLCDATVIAILSSAVPSFFSGAIAPQVASTCGGLQLRMMQPNGACGVAAMPPPVQPPASLLPPPMRSPSTAPPPPESSAPAPVMPLSPPPPAVAAAAGPTPNVSNSSGLIAAAEVLSQLALALGLVSPPPAVQLGAPPAQHSSAERPAQLWGLALLAALMLLL